MRKGAKKFYLIAVVVFMVTVMTSIYLYGNGSGKIGQTRKTVQTGCGLAGCHGATANTGLGVSINGPASLARGQTAQFTVAISGSTGAGGGVNIAVSSGALVQPASTSNLQLLNGELTHKSSQTMPITYTFSYTAPAAQGTVTMYAVAKGAGFTTWNWAADKIISITPPSAVADNGNTTVPTRFTLEPNFPNPFNPATQISYALPKNSAVTLRIYNTFGHQIRALVEARQSPGRHTVTWDGRDQAGNLMSTGVYFYVFTAANVRLSRKMILLQ